MIGIMMVGMIVMPLKMRWRCGNIGHLMSLQFCVAGWDVTGGVAAGAAAGASAAEAAAAGAASPGILPPFDFTHSANLAGETTSTAIGMKPWRAPQSSEHWP